MYEMNPIVALILGTFLGVCAGLLWVKFKQRADLRNEAIAIGLLGGFAGGFQGLVLQSLLESGVIVSWLMLCLTSIAFSVAFLSHLFRRKR